MKYLKMLGLAAVAAMAFMAFAVSSASATTLEVGGVTKNETITITASLEAGTKAELSRTDGSLANRCEESHAHGYTTTFTGTHVVGPFTGHTAADKAAGQKPEDGLSFKKCERPVEVVDPGTLTITHESGTTSGTVSSIEATVKVGSPFGTLTCVTGTGTGTDVGTLTGVSSGNATMHINGVINCGFLVPTALWIGTYVITSPSGLGVSE